MRDVVISGAFDDIRSKQVRFLQDAARYGRVAIYLWSDACVKAFSGQDPKFPQSERRYYLEAVRYVDRVVLVDKFASRDTLPEVPGFSPDMWVVMEGTDNFQKRSFCETRGLGFQVIQNSELAGFPVQPEVIGGPGKDKKVLVTGCYDWFHSGHVRFFEETSALGDLYVVVGHDENVRLIKGENHPLFPEEERRFMVGAIRFVKQALISTGRGWMDAEPEIEAIRPDIYAVNEDGDKPEKRAFCERHGLEYHVLKRMPAAGLPRRESTHLRGY